MILRLSQKLNTKIEAGSLTNMPLDENQYADWSCHLFTADRTQYIIMSNTPSLYSCVMFGKGITNDGIGPGGNLSAIVYAQYLDENGWPNTRGVAWDNYFTAEYYRKEVPVWEAYAPGLFSEAGTDGWLLARLVGLALAIGAMVGLAVTGALARMRRGRPQ